MLVKTFKAPDMPEAIRMVKAEFGPDAMILSSRKGDRKGFLGRYRKPYCEVTAALDRIPGGADEPREKATAATSTDEAFQRSMLAPLARELKELRAKVETLSEKERQSPRPHPAPKEYGDPVWSKPAGEAESRILPRSEMEELKHVLLRSMGTPPEARRDDALVRQEQPEDATEKGILSALAEQLRDSGVEDVAISELLAPLGEAVAQGEPLPRLQQRLKESIAAAISCSGPFKVKRNGTRILALVGPTGVGKTTTIAKLAALAYKQGISVALITIDTFRVGAVEQLKTYSGIMGLPLTVAVTPKELSEAIAANSDKQLIFIDTAGRSPRDKERLLEMKSFLEVNPAIETHLCLAATTRDRELARTVARFGVLPVNGVLFTKLDESETFGCIVNIHLRSTLPLSYFTTGQRVPEDIEAATSGRLADLVVREMNS